MKINKNIFISVLLILVMLCIIGTASANDSLDDSLAADDSAIDGLLTSADDDLLGEGETTIYVDSSYDGDELGTEDNPYKTISTAVSNANGGDTIFIKNGEYTDSAVSVDKPLTFTGESPDGVIIKSGATGFVNTFSICYNLTFNNLYFKDVACSGANAVITVGGTSEYNNVYITNCVFDSCSGRYGAVRIFSKFGDVVIDNCKFLNTKASNGKYSGAIYFGSAGTNTYTVRNTVINGSTNTVSTTYGAIYVDRAAAGPTVLDNVTIVDCSFTGANGLISTKGDLNITNSKIINNNVGVGTLESGGLIWIQSGNANPKVNVETTIIANNTGTNYLVGASGDKTGATLNYNNIQNNTFATKVAYYDSYDLDYNYWGSNDQPSGVNVNNWAIEDNGAFTLNDGTPLAKPIPTIGEPAIGDENTTFVSLDGDDNNTGSADSPVATIAKAVEIAKTRTGEIIIQEGTYIENGIELDDSVIWSISGIGNVVIDGNASTTSIFKLTGNPSVTFNNIRFRNDKAKYGGAINGMGPSQTNLMDLDLTINHCFFEDMASSSRGGAVYLYYAKGNFLVNDSQFTNCTASSWGGAICTAYCAYPNGLNLVINGSTFEECFANNGACGYLMADTVTVNNSVFNNNSANYDSAAMQFYNATGFIDNCIITNNVGLKDSSYSSPGVAIKITTATGKTPTVTITNSVIENNYNQVNTYPAIYVDRAVLDISYSSIVNDLSIQTKDGTSSAVQGVAVVNNNWWGTHDPTTKVTGNSITLDNWVIMNVEANVSEALVGDKVKLTVDFNHINTTAGEIEELTGGVIPKTHTVQFESDSGTFVPATFNIKEPATKSSTYTVGDIYDVVSVSSEEALVEMSFVPEVPPYYGIIYVSKDGDNENDGSIDAPVATVDKAIELASIVGGSGQIIINEGSYKGIGYVVTKNLTIAGNGTVILDAADAEGKLFELSSSSTDVGKFELINLTLTNVNAQQYGVVYNYAGAHLILNNVNITNCEGTYLGSIIKSYKGDIDIINCVISDNTAGRICDISSGYNNKINATVINTTFKNNTAVLPGDYGSNGYAVIDVSSMEGTLTIADSHFIDNTAKLGTVYTTSNKVAMDVSGTEFVNNNVTAGNGGGIYGYTMTVNDCTFINNTVDKDGGAIMIGRLGDATVTNCKFDNNVAGGRGNAIYNGYELTVNYCAFVNNAAGDVIYHNGEDNVMDANYNWWGTNDDPSALIGVGEYEDDYGWGYEDCEYDASKWVVMNVNNNLTAEAIEIGDQVEFTVDFNHYTDSTGTIYELTDSIPEVDVSASAIKGSFDNEKTTTENGVATLIYTADIGGEDTATIISDNAVNTTIININEPVVIDVIYVGPNGDDSNNGTYDHPVATIAHAIDIAEYGKIVIFEGTYSIDSTLVIDKDLDISGEGTVVIDGNSTRIIENTANLNLTNIAFTNAKMGFGSVILDDGNVTINNCTFYANKATASTSGNIINNRKGTMTINDSEFYENTASRGAVASQSGTNLVIDNSKFYDNDMSLSGANSYYGIIYSNSADTIVENTVFRNNKAKQGAGIWATRSTYGTTGSLEVINCTFENNIAEIGTGGAVFTSGGITANIRDSTFINNTATRSENNVGGNGGAIYTTGSTNVNVVNSVFIDNAGFEDAGIYASGDSFSISNSVILAKDGDANYALNAAGATVTAENNFWGDNTKANTNANVNKWVIMSADYDAITSDLDISFDKTNSTDGTIADYDDVLPDGFNVTVSSSSGALDETLPVIAGQASTNYVPSASDNITVKSGNAEVIIEIVIEPKVIYVSVNGNDENTGSINDPVATIAHAIELADDGRIIILEGTYTTGDLGIISDDLNITGEGTVIIDAQNANRILYVGENANVVLTNLIMINGARSDESGALLGNSNNLTLINCTLANSSAGINNGGAIYNVGKLTIINSTIANNTARVGGAIFNDYSAKGTELTIINSTFENNVANGNNNNGGGAIFAQRIVGLTINNTTFIDNEALTTSSGGAIGIIYADAEFTIDDSTFIGNHANGQESTGGGAIYIAGTSNNQRSGKLSISNTLFEENTADNDGAAIYARATTVDVSNSVIFANKDPAGFAVYGYKTDVVSPAITLNDNWWGSNDDPKDIVGGNNNYKPTVSRWVILTANNDTPIVEGNTVKITVSLDTYTNGEETGALANPISIPRDVSIVTTFDSIDGILENGEFTTNYLVPAGLDYISAIVDTEEIVLYKVKTETALVIENITAVKGTSALINVTVTANDTIVFTGEVEVYIGDDLVATIPVVEGSAIQEIVIDKSVGVYNISAIYNDNLAGDFQSSEASATLNVIEYILTVKASNYYYYGTNKFVPAELTDSDGNPVVGAEITMYVGEDNYTEVTDSNGQVKFSTKEVLPGKYNATIQVNDISYNVENATSFIFIYKLDTTIVVDPVITIYPSENITATLIDRYSNGVANASVIVKINGKSSTVVTDDDGLLVVSSKGLSPGSYEATFKFKEDETHKKSNATATVVIEQAIATNLTAKESNWGTYGVDKYVPVTLTDAYGNPVVGADVTMELAGNSTTITTNSKGQAKFNVNGLLPGVYTAVFTYDGNADGSVLTATAKVVMCRLDSNITVDPVISIDAGDNITATLVDSKGNGIADAKVVVKLNGKSTTVITDDEGKLSLSTVGVAPGSYEVTFDYKQSAIYKASAATATVIIEQVIATNLTAKESNWGTYGVDKYVPVTLTDAYGNPVVGADVTMELAGNSTTLTTDSKGQAKFNVNGLLPGVYTAVFTYDGNADGSVLTATAKVVMCRLDSNIIVDPVISIDAGDNITATLVDSKGNGIANESVTVKINGKSITNITDDEGRVIFSSEGIVPGDYTATFKFKQNAVYKTSNATSDVHIDG